ncbi:MAG: hypothetical protein IJN74_01410 [Clostridia bacterium]|nr:hypothetical protein [Clostridia bacterium]
MKKKIKLIVAVCTALFILINLIFFFVFRTSSEIVYFDTMEEAFGTTLYLFKDEVVIPTPDGGVLRPTAKDGERVYRGARIGAVLSSDTDEAALHEYLRIQDRITRLSEAGNEESYADTVRTDEQISSLSLQISTATEKGDMAKLGRLKDELLIAKDEKSAAGGQTNALIGILQDRQKTLATGIGNSMKEIYSPEAGTLLLHTDGMETDMGTKKAEKLTPSSLAEIVQNISPASAGCKVLYNSTWKGACTIDEHTAGLLKVGQVVNLRFHDADEAEEKATVSEISEAEDGNCVVVFSSNRTANGLLERRKVSVDVILHRHQGLRVPAKAITEEEGVQGVYVQTITDKVFRAAEVSYIGEGYAIIKEGEKTKLKLYDTVIY